MTSHSHEWIFCLWDARKRMRRPQSATPRFIGSTWLYGACHSHTLTHLHNTREQNKRHRDFSIAFRTKPWQNNGSTIYWTLKLKNWKTYFTRLDTEFKKNKKQLLSRNHRSKFKILVKQLKNETEQVRITGAFQIRMYSNIEARDGLWRACGVTAECWNIKMLATNHIFFFYRLKLILFRLF